MGSLGAVLRAPTACPLSALWILLWDPTPENVILTCAQSDVDENRINKLSR